MNQPNIAVETAALSKLAMELGPHLLGAITVLVAGGFFANWLSKVVARNLARTTFDATLRPVIATVFHYTAWGIVLLVVLQQFGVQTATLLALLGTAGLAIGLALQGTLSNVAAGLVLLILRPFEVQDQVIIAGETGTVLALSLFHTKLRSSDGVDIIVPNTAVLKTAISNMSRYPDRVLSLSFRLAADADLKEALTLFRHILSNEKLIITDLPKTAHVVALDDKGSLLMLNAWVRNADYDEARTNLLCTVHQSLKAASIPLL